MTSPAPMTEPVPERKRLISWDPDAFANAQKWHSIAQAWFRYLEWITLAAIVQIAFVHAQEPLTRAVLLAMALATLWIGFQVIQSYVVAMRFERLPFANQPTIRSLLTFVILVIALAASRIVYLEAIRGLRPSNPATQSIHQVVRGNQVMSSIENPRRTEYDEGGF